MTIVYDSSINALWNLLQSVIWLASVTVTNVLLVLCHSVVNMKRIVDWARTGTWIGKICRDMSQAQASGISSVGRLGRHG